MKLNNCKVSIIMLTHNAMNHCRIAIKSIHTTKEVHYDLIVVDNKSNIITKIYLFISYMMNKIHRLCFLNKNTLFSRGNNIGSEITSRDSDYILLINSDIQVVNPAWLINLIKIHKRGITAYGLIKKRYPRADGFCLLVDKDLYLKYKLDEKYPWWWSVTKLQADLLNDGFSVQAIQYHDHMLRHFGGKSGNAPRKILGERNNLTDNELKEWFKGRNISVVETI